MVEEVAGDVAEHNLSLRTDSVERAEPDQPVAAADVEHGVAFAQSSVVEHTVADGCEHAQRVRELLGVAAVSPLEQPVSPPVAGWRAHPASASSAWRSSGAVTIANSPFSSVGQSDFGRSR